MNNIMKKAAFIAGLLIVAEVTMACTRVVYLGDNDVMTARSMDWKQETGTDLWILPSHVKRTGLAGPNSIQWISKYGSVVATGYDVATTDGVNEKGLAANLLWLVESEYPDAKTNKKPPLSISLWAQYVLDNYATVSEAVKALEKEPFIVVTDTIPGDNRLTTLHLSISDSSGDSAIIEYIGGKQVIHHDRKYQVMTNSPTFDQQLALNTYWQQIGGTVMLPGTNRASDRFARASFYTQAIPKNGSYEHSLASVFGVIRNVSVPFGLNTQEEPNISSTRWRTVVDHKRGLYFFESAVSSNTFWVDLKEINFKDGKSKKLTLGKDQAITYAGKANSSFKETKPFEFLGIK
ncbi:linear amide C-N hydrolase [Acinetobacter seifertii]|uniref:Linear amide C-N hydrolase n=1 Tax=Acinetobacter seifertii TaxID=1530123 RepID=A0A7H2SAK5_9GAMM|nr:linear amide C-N hydrolase [Acinetobacter seifertii]QNX13040.1 linear amide C-N hydrolase [Acinetobacter seifertii]QNX19004.1 linear amide C-N hydrolase [Acinetobacter seifertii]QNX25611.1 linear amide C-N hydrolase [Acinetobacter seifertii]QNX36638.1 linear amide C-N hydrolase [Acinetobacter seifertii]QNX40435.1 linear amide C-N hydrolase [Acinetobacter seifertii]